MVFSVDQYKNDQIMQLQYDQESDQNQKIKKSYGLKMWDRPDSFTLGKLINFDDSLKKLNDTGIYNEEIQKLREKGLLGHERLFVGKTKTNEVGLFIRGEKGYPELKFLSIQPINRLCRP